MASGRWATERSGNGLPENGHETPELPISEDTTITSRTSRPRWPPKAVAAVPNRMRQLSGTLSGASTDRRRHRPNPVHQATDSGNRRLVQRQSRPARCPADERLGERPRAVRASRACRCRGRFRRSVMPSAPRTASSGGRRAAAFMNSVQIGSAACEPVRPIGWLSSKPTQTTVSSSGVKPTNQASRRSLVVPLLPAASSVNPSARAPAPVPSLITLRIMFVTRNVVSGRATGLPGASLRPQRSRSRPRCGRCALQRPDGAAVGEQRVGLRHLERRQLEDAERDRRKRPAAACRRRPGATARRPVEADLLADANRAEVARHGERAAPGDLAVVVVVVLRLPDLVVERERGRLVERQRRRREVGAPFFGRALERGEVDERLEDRSRLAARRRRAVVLRLVVRAAADHRQDLAGSRIDGDQRRLGALAASCAAARAARRRASRPLRTASSAARCRLRSSVV